MKQARHKICPRCSFNLEEARRALGEKQLLFCLECQFPLALVAGKYRLDKVLAEGGYGFVYIARHIYLETDDERVVKILKPEVFKIDGMEQRFYREVQVTSALSQKDEHIIRIYDDFGKIPKVGPFYVMEYLRGTRLDAFMVNSTHLPSLTLILHVFRQLCHAMHFAHQSGVVHRDLKPENLFLVERRGDKDFLKIIDFGIAKPMNQREFKMTQGVLGTPFYMAPEQCLNQEVDERTDIYAMGCILFELLTGFPPFHPQHGASTAASLVEVLGAHIGTPPPSPIALRPERVSRPIEEILFKALEKNPHKRFQTAQEMLRALEQTFAPLPSSEYLQSINAPTPPPASRPSDILGASEAQGAMESPKGEVLGSGEFLPLRSDTLHTTPPLPGQELPALGGVSSHWKEGHIQLHQGPAPSWDDGLDDDPDIAPFWATLQGTLRPSDGGRYYRRAAALLLLLTVGMGGGWWVFWRGQPAASGKPGKAASRKMGALSTQPRPASIRPRAPRPASKGPVDGGPAIGDRDRAPSARKTPSRRHKRPAARKSRRRPRRLRRRRRRLVRRAAIARRRPSPRRVLAPRPGLRRLPPRRRPPVAGCPMAPPGTRWARIRMRSSVAANARVLRGRASIQRHANGFCVQLRSRIRIIIEALEYQPCSFNVAFKHQKISIRLKKDSMNDIEINRSYCVR